MKSRLIIVLLGIMLVSIGASAQVHIGRSRTPMFFDTFAPAIIKLANGKTITHKQANIFLKNGGLVYKRGTTTMQANSNQIAEVLINKVDFIKVDTTLAYIVDSLIVDSNRADLLVCTRLIDMEAYRNQVINGQHLTSLTLGDNIGMTYTDVSESDKFEFPITNYYYYRINGKFINVHEREIKRNVPKKQFNLIESIMMQPGFKWTDEKYLRQILGVVSKLNPSK